MQHFLRTYFLLLFHSTPQFVDPQETGENERKCNSHVWLTTKQVHVTWNYKSYRLCDAVYDLYIEFKGYECNQCTRWCKNRFGVPSQCATVVVATFFLFSLLCFRFYLCFSNIFACKRFRCCCCCCTVLPLSLSHIQIVLCWYLLECLPLLWCVVYSMIIGSCIMCLLIRSFGTRCCFIIVIQLLQQQTGIFISVVVRNWFLMFNWNWFCRVVLCFAIGNENNNNIKTSEKTNRITARCNNNNKKSFILKVKVRLIVRIHK